MNDNNCFIQFKCYGFVMDCNYKDTKNIASGFCNHQVYGTSSFCTNKEAQLNKINDYVKETQKHQAESKKLLDV